uniref:Putative secreted protein n=1 Tax=Amblyomma triste TaxID=251400 RepID=A0A023G167_AMBTT
MRVVGLFLYFVLEAPPLACRARPLLHRQLICKGLPVYCFTLGQPRISQTASNCNLHFTSFSVNVRCAEGLESPYQPLRSMVVA